MILLREKHILHGKLERNVACDLNDFSWFGRIDFRRSDGIVFTAGGLFYYFEKEQVRRLLCAMAERDYIDGYLKGGWRKSIVTRIFAWVMRTFHMSFMIHAEFRFF